MARLQVTVSTKGTNVFLQSIQFLTASNGLIFQAKDPNVQSNGSPAACQINTHGDMGCTGDVVQTRPANGLVKALIFFDPFQPFDQQIVRCYNSQLSEPDASTPPCHFTHVHIGLGDNSINFGFAINDRFFQATASFGDFGGDAADTDVLNNTTVEVTTFSIRNQDNTDTPFYLTVF